MICDYCRRPVVTDSKGRCVNCGAQHESSVAVETSDSLRGYENYAERLRAHQKRQDGILGALLGGLGGITAGMAIFKM